MTERFVVVATYWGLLQAKMASEVLASEGIAVRLADEGIAAANPLLAPAVGGVRVLVPGDLADEAMAVLRLRGLVEGGEVPAVDPVSLEDEAMDAEPADESVQRFVEARKKLPE